MRKANPQDYWGDAVDALPAINWRRLISSLILIAVVLAVFWGLSSGFYTVFSNERGVVRRLGKVVRETQPGLHFKLPWPIEVVDTPNVAEFRRVEIGFRTVRTHPRMEYQSVPEESSMLTGDTNIVDLDLIVQYRVSDARDYLFNVRNVHATVKDAAEAAIRQVVGDSNIDDILTTEKTRVALDTQRIVQEICDRYDCGVEIFTVQLQDVYPPDPVRAAFAAVNSAREEKNQMINEAEAYKERIIPEAKGLAEKILREAEGYRQERIARAQGDAARFRSILSEYSKAPDITRDRLYLECMEKVLPGLRKYIVDAEDQGGLLKLLPLQEGGLSQ